MEMALFAQICFEKATTPATLGRTRGNCPKILGTTLFLGKKTYFSKILSKYPVYMCKKLR
jgi:hypothetical protein